MPWGRIDDGFYRHGKRRMVRLAADGLLVRAISRTSDLLSDGWVEASWVDEEFRGRDRRIKKAVLAEMKLHRLLVPLPAGATLEITTDRERGDNVEVTIGPHHADGFVVHGYLDCNPTRAELEAERSASRSRQRTRRARQAQTQIPWNGSEEPIAAGGHA